MLRAKRKLPTDIIKRQFQSTANNDSCLFRIDNQMSRWIGLVVSTGAAVAIWLFYAISKIAFGTLMKRNLKICRM